MFGPVPLVRYRVLNSNLCVKNVLRRTTDPDGGRGYLGTEVHMPDLWAAQDFLQWDSCSGWKRVTKWSVPLAGDNWMRHLRSFHELEAGLGSSVSTLIGLGKSALAAQSKTWAWTSACTVGLEVWIDVATSLLCTGSVLIFSSKVWGPCPFL